MVAIRLVDLPQPSASAGESTGQRIRRLRNERRWSQRELMARSGVHWLTIQRAEHDGDMFAYTLDALAQALGCSMDELWHGATS